GGSWGSMAIPRIGQDVIIQYVNGDPDQPMITGRTYCGDQLPPYDLPEHKTRMTIKSQTHKGDGYNELRFEDELGKEEVFIHAQRDKNNVVGNDETTRVGRNRVEQVGNDEQLSIGNNFRQETAYNHTQVIGQNSLLDIKRDLVENVANNRTESTGGNHRVLTGSNCELVVKGAQSISVGQGVQQRTTVFQLLASERIELRSPGGSIVLDAQGITINGLTLDLKGQTKAVAKGDGDSPSFELTPDASSKCEVKA
ncbi:type VI secretion system Vgr family protein, partial [Pseudomonas monteilii]|nr:type VI secretion system tip protein VgrG [Pseudomonas monteilii]